MSLTLGLTLGITGGSAASPYGPELVANVGDPFTDTTDWLGSNCTLSVVSGAMRLTNTANNGKAYDSVVTEVGKSYRYTVEGVNRTGTNYHMEVRDGVEATLDWTSGEGVIEFVAAQASTQIEVYAIGASGIYAEYAIFSVREIL